MAASRSRAALFLMDSDALALELEGVLRAGGTEWMVMLTRAVDSARAAMLTGPVDVAVLVPAAAEAIDDLVAGLHDLGTPTILVATSDRDPTDPTPKDLLTRLAYPLDPDVLKSALHAYACGSGDPSRPHGSPSQVQ
ncbi:hypothetical protein [Microbaculum sp. FT89]|uniref:hypothetical protein n=1 Tax=Microbaculum sp. FT89 TaxID=3447298 RepID=UPI003F53DA50